jgi:hypothetical protein
MSEKQSGKNKSEFRKFNTERLIRTRLERVRENEIVVSRALG